MEAINANKQEPQLSLGKFILFANKCMYLYIKKKIIADTNARKNFVKVLQKQGEVSYI